MNSHPSVQNLTDTANANIQTFQSMADIVLNATQRLTTINLETARSAFAMASANSVPTLGEGMREQIANRISAQGQGVELAASYLRNVNEIFTRTQSDITRLGAKRVNESTAMLNAVLDSVAKSGPAGTPDVVSAIKTALNTATAAFENILETTREVTENNFAAAVNALQNSVNETAAVAKSSKKAA